MSPRLTSATPPAPEPLTRAHLRAINARNREKRDKDVATLLREIKRLHRVLLEVHQIRESVDKAWKEEVGEQLVGLYMFRRLLEEEPAIAGYHLASGADPGRRARID